MIVLVSMLTRLFSLSIYAKLNIKIKRLQLLSATKCLLLFFRQLFFIRVVYNIILYIKNHINGLYIYFNNSLLLMIYTYNIYTFVFSYLEFYTK
jgi:hypothetical protein